MINFYPHFSISGPTLVVQITSFHVLFLLFYTFGNLVFLFADSNSKLFLWISAEVRSCALQYVFLSTKSAFGFWSHYALEVVEKVMPTVYMCTNDINFFNGIRGLF